MWQPQAEREPQQHQGLLENCAACLSALLRCCLCLNEDSIHAGEGGQRLLSSHQEALGIEASASPPRLPLSSTAAAASASAAASSADEHGPLLKGHGPSSTSRASLASASPPMPPPFFPATARHKRGGSAGSCHSSGGGGGGGGGGSPQGASPTAGDKQRASGGGGGKAGGLFDEEEDVCPTCLDPYTEDNPAVLTRCGHRFHLPCLFEWLERSETCPVCSEPMQFEEIV